MPNSIFIGFQSVTAVSVVSAHGVSGVVANPNTTPAITLTLGDITPSKVTVPGGEEFINTSTSLTDGAGVAAGTLLNAPAAGNPKKWVGLNDNGTIRQFPTW